VCQFDKLWMIVSLMSELVCVDTIHRSKSSKAVFHTSRAPNWLQIHTWLESSGIPYLEHLSVSLFSQAKILSESRYFFQGFLDRFPIH